MENMDTFTMHLMVSQIINVLIHLLVLVACIIIATKKKSIATKLLLSGGILNIIGFFLRFILTKTAANKGSEALVNMQVTLSYLNNFIFLVFGLGLLLFAINDLKKLE